MKQRELSVRCAKFSRRPVHPNPVRNYSTANEIGVDKVKFRKPEMLALALIGLSRREGAVRDGGPIG
jgi:hypothetical protein